MSTCVGDSSYFIPFGKGKYFFYFMFELVNCGSLRAEEHNNYFSHPGIPSFSLFLSSLCFKKYKWNFKHSKLLGLIARFSSNHIWVFFNIWAIFVISIQQWPLEFRNHFLSPSLCPHETQHLKHLKTSGHLHICWHRWWRPLCGRFSNNRCWAWGRVCWFLRNGENLILSFPGSLETFRKWS